MLRKRKALTQKECENVIKIFDGITTVGTHTDQKRGDKERGYTVVGGDFLLDKYSPLHEVLLNSLREYVKKNKFLTSITWSIERYFNIQKYNPGEYYRREHCEHGNAGRDAVRVVAWMFYLNDIKRGGGTRWPQQNFTSKPRAGDLYIWPAGWTHSHYGISSPKETKYIVSGWGGLV